MHHRRARIAVAWAGLGLLLAFHACLAAEPARRLPSAPELSAADPSLAQLSAGDETPAINHAGRIRAQIVAQQQTTLSAELSAKISSLPFKEGDSFKDGQLLAQFDCSIFRAQLAKAEATAEAARQTLRVNRRLSELNAISNLEVELAAAKLKETEADAGAMQVTVEKCALLAPFPGRVAKVHAEPFQYVTQGKPLLDIIDNQRLEVKLIVPSRWLVWLRQGNHFTVRVDDLGKTYPVRVTRIGARIDPVSQTVSLAGQVEGARPELLPGMSGWATFKPGR